MVKLVFGCGYLGHRVARKWLDAGHDVQVVTRSRERADVLAAQGLRPIVADITSADTLHHLPTAETVLFAVGHDRSSGQPIRQVYVDGLRNVLDQLPPETGRFIYISSTGVYGHTAGDWVDETSDCRPERQGGHACLEAEQLLQSRPLGSRAIVLRLAGIYGPGRIPRGADLIAGLPIAAPSEGFLNLIHVEDAVQVVLLAEQRAQPPRTYVVSDGQPVPRREYYEELARLLGAPAPRFIDPPAESPAAQRAASDKRINNARCMAELQPRWKYPSYREGLAAAERD